MKIQQYEPKDFAATIFKDRYAISPEETFLEACQRVAKFIASAEDGSKIKEYEQRFQDVLSANLFSPGGRIWRGSGRKKANLVNCFVLPAEDSREGWGELLKNVTVITGMGGGIGINFSKIRPRGSEIKGTGGVATGAVSLMKIVNSVCNELREGGGRRSALMFCLDYTHPDIEEFLHIKLDKKELNNANISVLINSEFINLVKNDGEISLKWADKEVKKISAKWLYDKIIENSLATGDPGLLNIERAEATNNLHYCSKLSSVNPCGEQWLPDFDICDLGSIVLPNHLTKDNEIDYGLLENTIRLAVRFLDNVLDKTEYPLIQIKETCQNHRRIGLGVIGLHDLLLRMNIKYSSEEAIRITDSVMSFIKKKAYETSIFLSVEKGQFPRLDRKQFVKSGFCRESLTPAIRQKILEYGIRNCAILTQPPTGTTSIVSGCSSGIEPMFSPVYRRNFNAHKDIQSDMTNQSSEIVIHPLVKEFLEQSRDISHFEGAHEISPEQHCKIQAVCQKHIDSAVSKTINLPENATKDQLSDIILSYIPKLKGLTIYRDGSKGKSPIETLSIEMAKDYLDTCSVKNTDNSCPNGVCEL